jgi:RNA polymerase sigma-70 factor (ECF subfamily)
MGADRGRVRRPVRIQPPTIETLPPSNLRVTDDELVALARQGDTTAFGELARRHQGAVFRTALVIARSHHDAEDIAQEALVVAWKKLAGFKGHAQFKTWLLTITWRHALSQRRSRWSRLMRFAQRESDETALGIAAPAMPPDDTLAAARFAALLRQLVNALPSKLRDPLLLAAAGECTFEEMARMLAVPSGTLKWRVMEARRRLKRELAARGYEWT